MPDMFKNATLLITGGTGTFGHAVLGRLLHSDIGEIRIFSRDEKKQDDMRRRYGSPKLKFYLGDVRERRQPSRRDARRRLRLPCRGAEAGAVAASSSRSRRSAPTSLGAENVLTAAIAGGVKRVVVLSTDKAVYPINAMGMSKAMMEKIAVAKPGRRRDRTVICITRYGNVMASRGSVIPLFVDQIQDGAAADGHRPGHDAVHDVARRRGRPRPLRVRERHVRAIPSSRRRRRPRIETLARGGQADPALPTPRSG